MARAKPNTWLTTDEIAAATSIAPQTIRRWGRLGVLGPAEIVFQGRRGRHARWPLHTAQQARWVLGMLERGHTFAEIAEALARGEFHVSGGKRP